jgi:hypothetical protein
MKNYFIAVSIGVVVHQTISNPMTGRDFKQLNKNNFSSAESLSQSSTN